MLLEDNEKGIQIIKNNHLIDRKIIYSIVLQLNWFELFNDGYGDALFVGDYYPRSEEPC